MSLRGACPPPLGRYSAVGAGNENRNRNDLGDNSARRVVASVALPNDASVALRLSRRFRAIGTFHDYAIEHGTVISSTWFERPVML